MYFIIYAIENTQHILQDKISERLLPEQDKVQEEGVAAESQSVQGEFDVGIE